jgi:hypothetical protein
MSERDGELENARSRLLKKMQEPQGHQSLSAIRQELRAIDAEMEHLKKSAPKGSPFESPFTGHGGFVLSRAARLRARFR